MKDRLIKSWQTTILGLIVLAYVVYNLFWLNNKIDFVSIIEILVSIGFIGYKQKSNNNKRFSTVDPDKEEKPSERG